MKNSNHCHFYDVLSRFYDDFYKTKNYEGEVQFFYDIFKGCGNVKTDNVLDVGCGTGSHLVYISHYFKNVYGIDPSAAMLDIAKKKLKDRSCFFCERIQDFEHSAIFNLIVSYNSALNYLDGYDELCKAFNRIFALLVKFGVVVVQLHNCVDKDYLMCKASYDGADKLIVVGDWLRRNSWGSHQIDFFYHLCSHGVWSSYHDVHKEYFFTKDEIYEAMKLAGFSHINIREISKDNSPFNSSEYICVGIKDS